MRDHHLSGESFDDALALITASVGPNDEECHQVRLRTIHGIVTGTVDAGPRLAAATEMLAGIAAGILEGWAADSGVDPYDLLQTFALEQANRRSP